MATVYFYEKPGCVNNRRQKQLLSAAGHQVIAKNLLSEVWHAERLRAFFGDLPVRNWFNYNAPAIKIGQVKPEKMTEQQALALMVENPLLIRRPLMQVGKHLKVGFDQYEVDAWIGLTETDTARDLETCARTAAMPACGHE